MTDISPIPIPPRDLGALDNLKQAKSAQPSETAATNPNFQQKLVKALGQISQETDQVDKLSAPAFKDVHKAMDQAKNAFTETMQTHQLMMNLMKDVQPAMPKINNPPDEEK